MPKTDSDQDTAGIVTDHSDRPSANLPQAGRIPA